MIKSFGDKTTEDIYHKARSKASRKIASYLHKTIQRKLDLIDSAYELEDLKVPPGNRLEALSGNLSGKYSIRINDQWRIVFNWSNHNADNVIVTDYHK